MCILFGVHQCRFALFVADVDLRACGKKHFQVVYQTRCGSRHQDLAVRISNGAFECGEVTAYITDVRVRFGKVAKRFMKQMLRARLRTT
jgi:hypothetical protein